MKFSDMSKEDLLTLKNDLTEKYEAYKARNLNLVMTRGVPSSAQLDMTQEMLDYKDFIDEDGTDCRNYGCLTGLRSLKNIFAELLELNADQIIIGGNSSLSIMHDTLVRYMLFGAPSVGIPWCKQDRIRFLCPVPGYDRHFTICEKLGIEMINVPMDENGPDMDFIESAIAEDDSIKGVWCVPKYSNPTGVTYSDEVVRRFANLKPAAADFIVMWDNAYAVHDLYEDRRDTLLNIAEEAKKAGTEDMIYIFASTSKVTLAGAGVSMMYSSPANIARMTELMGVQTIGNDKINQLQHVKYLKNAAHYREIMARHASILRPKFEIVLEKLNTELGDPGIASWSDPNGGYFVNLQTISGCADKVVKLAADAGVKLTSPAGSAFPYKKDPDDRNIRLAPTFPCEEDLKTAMDVVCLCVKLASVESLL